MTKSQPESLGAPGIIIHHVEGRRSQRVIWLCEELALAYRLSFARGDVENSLLEIREVCPLMPVAPVVVCDGRVLVESGAILEYLRLRHGDGRLAPPMESPDYADYLTWMHFAEGSAMARLVVDLERMALTGATQISRQLYRETQVPKIYTVDVLRFVEARLAEAPFFAGPAFSTADIMMHLPIKVAGMLGGVDMALHPSIGEWTRRVEERAAFARSMTAALPDGKPPDARR